MSPKEQAIQAVEQLITDVYNREFKWVPSWLGKKVMKTKKVRKYAERIMDISEKYVDAVVKEDK